MILEALLDDDEERRCEGIFPVHQRSRANTFSGSEGSKYHEQVTMPSPRLQYQPIPWTMSANISVYRLSRLKFCCGGMQQRQTSRRPSAHFHSAWNETSFHFFLGIARIDSAPFIPRPESELRRTNAVQCIKQTLRNPNTVE